MLAAFIFLPAGPSLLSCVFILEASSLVKSVLITKRLILQTFCVNFSLVHKWECFRKRKQHRFFFLFLQLANEMSFLPVVSH